MSWCRVRLAAHRHVLVVGVVPLLAVLSAPSATAARADSPPDGSRIHGVTPEVVASGQAQKQRRMDPH
jgi:hypothetical protein